MFSKKQMPFIATFTLLVFVILAAEGSNADDAVATSNAVISNSNGDDPALPDFDGDGAGLAGNGCREIAGQLRTCLRAR